MQAWCECHTDARKYFQLCCLEQPENLDLDLSLHVCFRYTPFEEAVP